MKQTNPIYHYTSLEKLMAMLNAGAILPSKPEGDVPPLVWASTARLWEPMAVAAVDLDVPDVPALRDFDCLVGENRPVRIEIPKRCVREWDVELLEAGTKPSSIFALAQIGYDYGSDPVRWYVSTTPILAVDWIRVEVWREGRWVRVYAQPMVRSQRRGILV